MQTQTDADQAERFYRLVIYGLLAPIVSAIIALLIANGIAEPYPDAFIAYLACLVIGASGLVTLIFGIAALRFSR